jgi:hypothetical protein
MYTVLGKPGGTNNWEDLDIDGRITLNYNLEELEMWTGLSSLGIGTIQGIL